MGDEPIAFQGGEKRLNFRIHARGEGSVCHCQEGEESGEHAEGPLLGPVFHGEINEHDRPGCEYQRFIKIGKRRVPVTYLVGFPPAENHSPHLHGERSRPGDTAPEHNLAVVKDDPRKIEKRTEEIGKRRYGKEDRTRNHDLFPPPPCPSSSCRRSQSMLKSCSKDISFLFVLPAMIIFVPSLPASAAAHTHNLRWLT